VGRRVSVLAVHEGGDSTATPWLSQREGGGLRRLARHVGDVCDPGTKSSAAAAFLASPPSLVHVHIFQGMSIDAVRAVPKGTPIVWTFHDYGSICPRNTLTIKSGADCSGHKVCAVRRKLIEQTLRSRVTRFLAPSERLLERHLDDFPWMSARSVVLPNPIADPTAASRPRRPVDGKLSVGFLGKRTHDKGFDLALDLLAHPNVTRMVIAGPGGLVAQEGVLDRGIVAPEELDRVFWSEIDVLVVPSRWPEIGPLVAAESVARGIPVIGPRRGGIPETLNVDGQVAGAILDDWSLASAGQALKSLSQRADWERASRLAYKAGEPFDLQKHGQRLVALYDELTTA
jgi:glycosyltransferase involved in cell wall biosynthesis